MKHQPTINIHNQDCMEAMAKMEDNAFDLAIVDPPYGIGVDGGKIGYSEYDQKEWDSKPISKEQLKEIFRVSQKQIMWGFNHYLDILPNTKAIVFWHKHQNGHFSEGEAAWSSHGKTRFFDRPYQKDIGHKIHPTQKPVALYKWLLKNYANEGDKILDTHMGSGSIAIACHDMGFDLEAYEIDQEYHQAALQRLNTHRSQLQMF